MVKWLSDCNEHREKIYRYMQEGDVAVIDTKTGIVYQCSVDRQPWFAAFDTELEYMLETNYLD